MTETRRASDRRFGLDRRHAWRRKNDGLRSATWDDQRAQFLTRYLFWALYLAYFNLGTPVARAWPGMIAVEIVGVLYFVVITAYLLHARRHMRSAVRWRLAMWTDLLMVSFSVMADSSPMSPAYLAYIMVILGNGMRYGMRLFAETLIGTFSLVAIITVVRFSSYLHALSAATLFFLAFFGIIILYAYSLMANIEKTREQLEVESNLDLLTGLLNRRGLRERSESMFHALDKNDHTVAVLFADLDRFKAINDVLGHHVGDHVLKEIGQIISGTVRDSDVAARFGGDEFVIIMPDTDIEQAGMVAQRLQAAVGQWSQAENIALSVSIGMGIAPAHGRDLESVLRCVDSAMYQGRQVDGRGGIRRAERELNPA